MKKVLLVVLSIAIGVLFGGSGSNAADSSFTGNFNLDNDVQLFNFSVGAPSTVTLRTWSYAGGTNAAGQVIARGGFDPILALFDSTGTFIDQNDDGGAPLVPADSVTGRNWDTYLSASLGVGTYTVSVMQFNNFANGPNLSNGFAQDGNTNFTATLTGQSGYFWAISPNQRDNHWAFDILNVGQAEVITTTPEPATMLLLGFGLVGLAGVRRFRKHV